MTDTPVPPQGRRPNRSAVLLLGLRLVGPYLIYTILNARLHNDLESLAIGAAIPIVVGAVISVKQRRIDWALALSALSLLTSLGIAAVIGHGSTIVKLRGSVAPAVMGIVFLVLAVGPASLRQRALKALMDLGARRAAESGRLAPPPIAPERRAVVAAHIRQLLGLWGVGLVVVSAVHVTIVLTVSTSEFFVASRAASLGIIGLLILVTRVLRTRWTAT